MTLLLLSKILEHKEAHLDALKGKVLATENLLDIRDELSIIKGQIYTLELLEDLELFLEIEEELEDEKIQTSRGSSSNKN